VGNVFAHDVPLIHARRCKGVGWLIKIEHSKETKKKKKEAKNERKGKTVKKH
jgi:glycine cleavage system H lipoate-binding protein